ncbi:MAG: hypothetical protein LBE13_04115, partial [Bacteroidales bacterium]|nr:hypothetical protein [Bacteroidales bacterium]
MKRIFIIVLGISMTMLSVYSQTIQTWTENFDSPTVSFNFTPSNAWNKNSAYYTSSPCSYRGTVAHAIGDSSILTTLPYDFSNYTNVQLKFKHICKISPMDIVRIEYKISQQGWTAIAESAYKGKADNYSTTGFNAESYLEWTADDSTALPVQSWWKEETFDLSQETSMDNAVQFRFIIKHGSISGTQVSYGWLLDDFKITVATYDLNPPVVEFISPLIRDTVYTTGPWEINARVKTVTPTPVKVPYLKYTAIKNNVPVVIDSILMTMVNGDSLWKASIPQFEAGIKVAYSITGIDTNNVQTIASSEYIIGMKDISYIIIGTDTYLHNNMPVSSEFEGSWSRQLYLGTELSTGSGATVITKMAWSYAYTGLTQWNPANQSCYFRAVDDTEISTWLYSDPVADNATLVWQGDLSLNSPGWIEFTLNDPFVLPPGKNLMIYWNNQYDTYISSEMVWNYSFTNFFSIAYGYNGTFADAIDPDSWYLVMDMIRPNTRFVVSTDAAMIPDNSVAVYSIDLSDTVAITQGVQIPLAVTIKNKGKLNLDSVMINYSINGNTFPAYKWKGNLPWDFNSSDTIDYYTPKPNGLDTILVWISMPNGVVDSKTEDDMLTKVIYGGSDFIMEFVNSPTGTVTYTGPFAINARINTLSGNPVGTVSLNVTTTHKGITTSTTLPVTFNVADNLWKTTIPHTLFGSNVSYSITLT